MDEYFLTEEDIMRLKAAGFDMMNTEAGMEALSNERAYLNMSGSMPSSAAAGESLLPPPPSDPTDTSVNTPVQLEVTDPAVIEPPAPASAQGVDRDTIMQVLMASQPAAPAAPADPFEKLSKTQRRMLAFAGLSDAGAALQGMQGGNVSALMGRFNDIADMERKRQAAAQQQLTLRAALGGQGGAAGAGIIDSPEAARARIAQLTQLAITNPSLAPALQLEISRLGSEAERLEALELASTEAATTEAATLNTARSSMETARRALGAALGLEGKELDQALLAEEIDPSNFSVARFTGGFASERYKEFRAAAQELEAVMTFQNMGDVIEAGAKLGTLSDADMVILGRLSGVIDVVNAPKQTADTIFRIYRKLNDTILELERNPSAVNDVTPEEQALVDKYRKMAAAASENKV